MIEIVIFIIFVWIVLNDILFPFKLLFPRRKKRR